MSACLEPFLFQRSFIKVIIELKVFKWKLQGKYMDRILSSVFTFQHLRLWCYFWSLLIYFFIFKIFGKCLLIMIIHLAIWAEGRLSFFADLRFRIFAYAFFVWMLFLFIFIPFLWLKIHNIINCLSETVFCTFLFFFLLKIVHTYEVWSSNMGLWKEQMILGLRIWLWKLCFRIRSDGLFSFRLEIDRDITHGTSH